MKTIMEKLAKADRMLAAVSVSGDNVLWLADARRELGDAYRMLEAGGEETGDEAAASA